MKTEDKIKKIENRIDSAVDIFNSNYKELQWYKQSFKDKLVTIINSL